MENRPQSEKLISKYLQDALSDEERKLVEMGFIDQLKNSDQHPSKERIALADRRIRPTLERHIGLARPKIKPMYNIARLAAAMVLVALGLGIYLYLINHTTNNQPVVGHGHQLTTNNDIAPGGNRAILTLADGRKIVLNEAANGELVEENGVKITKTVDGQVVYDVAGARITDARQPATYNTIQTPRGGQYKIILPDSSVVWLNSASSLRYPTRFSGAERRVELTGEAFFSVRQLVRPLADQTLDTKHKTQDVRHESLFGSDANKSKIVNHKSKIPFIVATATQEVQVLGTQFNINAYIDEAVVKTTLLEGSVRVVSTSDQSTNKLTNQSTILLPNQQSALQDGQLKARNVRVADAIAWKDNLFRFQDTEIHDIMRQLSRWYDLEVSFDAGIEEVCLTGYISRNVPLSKVLQMLSKTSKLKFEIKGKEVMVRK